jgi:phage terminase large subunit-like protein
MPLDLDRAALERRLELRRELEVRKHQRRYYDLYPDETVYDEHGEVASLHGDDNVKLYARALYPKHLEFFEATAQYREIGCIAANRVGKTVMGSYAVTAFLTGIYPDWWPGRRFTHPTRGWAAGKTYKALREIVQDNLLGEVIGSGPTKRVSGTGMIPGVLLDKPRWMQSVADVVDTIKVRHVSGKWSTLGLKSYEQGRGAFEGTAQDFIWDDEEPPDDVWGEQVTRTATTNGLVFGTFTPLDGMSETAMLFYPKDM